MSDRFGTQLAQARARWRTLPAIVRLGAVIAVAVVGYIVINDYAWAGARKLNAEADQIERTLNRALAARDALRRDLAQTVVARGPVRLPVEENQGKQAMADAVNEILQRRIGIGSYSYDSGSVSGFGRGGLTGVLPGGQSGARVTGEVKFEATPEETMAVIAEIESDPAIHGITRVHLTRSTASRVAVVLTVESWVSAPSQSSGRIVR